MFQSRRSFIQKLSGGTAITLLSKNTILQPEPCKETFKLRIAIASDGHYGQPDTDFATTHSNIIKWLNLEHQKNHLDFVIFNGDLVHDKTSLLKELKSKYLDRLLVPYYTVPGNHDLASTQDWINYFGYKDNFSIEKNGCIFIFANTSNVAGEYICPDYQFLKEELNKYKTAPMIFVILHIPPHLWIPEQTSFKECPDILSLLHENKNVKAVFHGHDHNLDSVWYTGDELPHFFDSHYGGNWGTTYHGYRILEISKENKIRTYQVNASNDPVLNKADIG